MRQDWREAGQLKPKPLKSGKNFTADYQLF